MAAYFKNLAGAKGMLPTVQETAAYYRERNIAAVIFPVDAERETGFRRYSSEEVAELCAENDDILIPFASVDPRKDKVGARARFGAWRTSSAFADSDSIGPCRGFPE